MSFYDITIVCSIILVGKPLHMHRQTADSSSAFLPVAMPINHLYQKFEMSLFCFWTRFRACDTLPQVFQCTLIPEIILLTKILVQVKADKNKNKNNYNTSKTSRVNSQ